MTIRSPEGANGKKGSRVERIFRFRPRSASASCFLLRGYTRGNRADRTVFFGGLLTFFGVPSNLSRRVQQREGRRRLASDTARFLLLPCPQVDTGCQKLFRQKPANVLVRLDQPREPIPAPLSRRSAIVGGLAVIGSSLLDNGASVAGPAEPPAFTSGRHQFTLLRPQQMLPSARLFHLDGGSLDLASFRGRPLLLNFWASWCAACRLELPVLEKLRESRKNLNIIAVSEDRGTRQQVARFVRSRGIRNLPIYLDPNGYVAHSDAENRTGAPFSLYGMPITYVVGSSGRVLGYMPGAADWNEPPALALIDYLASA
jgi:thiol-disulfide isomerase/thioredoxin